MTQNKTQPTQQKVSEFIASIEDTQKRNDCRELLKLMREITGNRATMWGPGIVGKEPSSSFFHKDIEF